MNHLEDKLQQEIKQVSIEASEENALHCSEKEHYLYQENVNIKQKVEQVLT